jgi:hypothetical protein
MLPPIIKPRTLPLQGDHESALRFAKYRFDGSSAIGLTTLRSAVERVKTLQDCSASMLYSGLAAHPYQGACIFGKKNLVASPRGAGSVSIRMHQCATVGPEQCLSSTTKPGRIRLCRSGR